MVSWHRYEAMKTCKSCCRVRSFSINFFKSICNECYLVIKSQCNHEDMITDHNSDKVGGYNVRD